MQDAVTQHRKTRPALVGEGNQLSIEDPPHREALDLGHQVRHVPAATAPDRDSVPGVDQRPEPVHFTSKAQSPRVGSRPAVGTRIAWLILIPGGGVRDAVVLQGVPKFLSLQEEADVPFLGKTKIKLRTSPCRAHAHGWQQQTVQKQSSGKVKVILRMTERRP